MGESTRAGHPVQLRCPANDAVNGADPSGLEGDLPIWDCYWTHEWHTGEGEPEFPYEHEHYIEHCGFADPSTRAAILMAASSPYFASGLGDQGFDGSVGGGGPAFAPPATEPGLVERREGKLLAWVANTALDAIALTGIGEGIRIAARGVGVLARGAMASLADPALSLGFDLAGQVGRRHAIAEAGAVLIRGGATEAMMGGTVALEAWDLRNQGYLAAATHSSTWLSLIPGYGFVTSSVALAKCIAGK